MKSAVRFCWSEVSLAERRVCQRIWRSQDRRSAGSRLCCGTGRELISSDSLMLSDSLKMKWLSGFDISVVQYFQTLKSTRMKVEPLKVPSVVTVKKPCVMSLGVKCGSLC